MSISNVSALQSVMTTQLSGGHHHCAGTGVQQNAPTSISSLSSLLSAVPASSSTAISTASSLLYSLPGYSSDSNPTNIVV